MKISRGEYCCGIMWGYQLPYHLYTVGPKPEIDSITWYSVGIWDNLNDEMWHAVTAYWIATGMFSPTLLISTPYPNAESKGLGPKGGDQNNVECEALYNDLIKIGFIEMASLGRADYHNDSQVLKLMKFDFEPWRNSWKNLANEWAAKYIMAKSAADAENLRRKELWNSLRQQKQQEKENPYAMQSLQFAVNDF